MAQMKSRNAQLQATLGAIAPKERLVAANSVPKEDTVNRQGHAAYALPDELRLVAMLNTLKLQPQFYRSDSDQMKELRDLVEKIGLRDPKFVAQAIVYSRCLGEGMRTINHLAAALVAPFISGQEYAKRFFGAFDKKGKKGGTIFRLDDMSEIKDAWFALGQKGLPASMRKGFASVLENADTYQMAKYKDTVIDIANLVHPNSKLSKAEVEVEFEGQKIKMKALDAIMKGIAVAADTWETAQSEAGQMVAQAVREGKLDKQEAEKVLAEAKADNWESLLKDGKLGVLAALRNIRNMMKNPRKEMIEAWCKLITDPVKVRQALILPIHFDLAYDVVDNEFGQDHYANTVRQALQDGYIAALPNLAAAFPGKTLIVVDNSGSMGGYPISDGKTAVHYTWNSSTKRTQTAGYKAGLIAATFAAATGGDIIQFGGSAHWFQYNKNENVFSLAKKVCTASDGWTNPHAAFELITRERKAYDRIIFISDNEVNGRITSEAYKEYVRRVCDPYVYGIDLCAYGTTPLKRDGKIQYFFGYGPSMYESVASSEFNPLEHIEKIRAIEI
jgi:polyhydroxyalkanoate synthesis regulator phasin